jgi:hypothetical protein
MKMLRVGKREVVVIAFAVAAAMIGGGVVTAQRGGNPSPDIERLQAAIGTAPMVRVADIPGDDHALQHGVFVQELQTGDLCVWDAPSASSRQRQGGCNSIDDPLGGSVVSANLAYDGGPEIEKVRDARLSGIADSDVARIVVVMSDGTERAVRLSEAHLRSGDYVAFGYRVKRSDLHDGIGPVAVVALDASGNEIARQTTGIG